MARGRYYLLHARHVLAQLLARGSHKRLMGDPAQNMHDQGSGTKPDNSAFGAKLWVQRLPQRATNNHDTQRITDEIPEYHTRFTAVAATPDACASGVDPLIPPACKHLASLGLHPPRAPRKLKRHNLAALQDEPGSAKVILRGA